ncbi:MAG: class I SAM-dependent RNA methyltransferase [Hyphomicrobium sp.]
MGETRDLDIVRLGARGDGIADLPSGTVFVPYALPGEHVRADVPGERGRLLDVLRPSAQRITPVCQHFTRCGGCALQHMGRNAYLAWKHQRVIDAFAARGIDATVAPVIGADLGARRRATFAARRTGPGAILGFHAARGHEIVDLQVCPVTAPEIVQALPGLRTLIEPLLTRRGEARLVVTLATNGLDLAIEGVRSDLSLNARERLARDASALKLARVSIGADTFYQAAEPIIRFGAGAVVPPPGAFLQAAPAAEAEMVRLVTSAMPKVKRIADLFCGLGTFTFPLRASAQVLAIDSDREAIAALQAAAKRTPGLKPLQSKVRDLFREPLSVKELEPFDAVVFDPPRAGAAAQAALLAKSKVATIAAVSCNPATLARDARTLIDGGYRLETVTLVDQFLFSAHIEAVAVFRR